MSCKRKDLLAFLQYSTRIRGILDDLVVLPRTGCPTLLAGFEWQSTEMNEAYAKVVTIQTRVVCKVLWSGNPGMHSKYYNNPNLLVLPLLTSAFIFHLAVCTYLSHLQSYLEISHL